MFKSQSFWGKRAVFAVIIVAAFLAGTVVNQFRTVQAEPNREGFSNQIIEISSSVTPDNPVVVYTLPDPTSLKIDTLLWGDRVLYRGVEQTDPAGVKWRQVDLAEGVTGWITASLDDFNTKRLVFGDAVFTTPGIGVGTTITVSADGAGANLRENPSVAATRVRKLTAGEVLTVVAGPYQAEYFVWWQVQDASGALGWVVDVQSWFAAAAQ
ncbi:MAG: SH3 domain-containing protein [Chloroflexi bacterium]|nr:SH3 domain-containing protein [Chloroflexota bacterium]